MSGIHEKFADVERRGILWGSGGGGGTALPLRVLVLTFRCTL